MHEKTLYRTTYVFKKFVSDQTTVLHKKPKTINALTFY